MAEEKVKELEEREAVVTEDARALAFQMLMDRGYLEGDLTPEFRFHVKTANAEETVTVDYAVRIEGRPVMAVKCSMALDSRERHVLAMARLMDSTPAPYAVVTDGLIAHVLDTRTGKLISHEIPTREDALTELSVRPAEPLPAAKIERERCVLLAFECASCPKPTEQR